MPEAVFQAEAARVLGRVQRALLDALESLGPGVATRPTELSGSLSLDTKLAWKLVRIVGLSDPFSAGAYMPGPEGVRIVIRALREAGVSAARVDELASSFEDVDRLMAEHAGDRRTLDLLLSGLAEEERDRGEIEQRRGAFRATSYLWGVEVSTRLMAFVIGPSAVGGDRIDVAHVAGLFGVRRLRHNVPWRVAQLMNQDDSGEHQARPAREVIDPESADGPALMRAFCAGALPELVPVERGGGRVEYRLGGGPIGAKSAFDLVLGEIMRNAGGRYRSEGDSRISAASRNRTPARRVILDLVVDGEMFPGIDPRAILLGELWGENNSTDEHDPERLPMFERVQRLGRGPRGMRCPHVPRYAAMMSAIFARMGWDPSRFEAFRVEMEYPLAPTVLRMYFPLPERPG